MSANAAIVLTQGMRNSLYALSGLDDQITVVNKRLATGKKVNDALDNPLNFFLAQGFDKQKRDLGNLLDGQTLGLKLLEKTVKTIESITKLVESAQALARQARQTTDAVARNTYGTQVGILLQQIDELTEDAGFNGRNLLKATPDTVNIKFNALTAPGETELVVVGASLRGNSTDIALNTAALGVTFTAGVLPQPHSYAISSAVGSWEANAAGDTRLDAFITASQSAINNLAARASTFSVNLTVVQVRLDYTKSWQRNLAESSDALTAADLNEEGASLSALQTRQQLAVTSLSLANRSDQSILRLFN
jgi:flagellin